MNRCDQYKKEPISISIEFADVCHFHNQRTMGSTTMVIWKLAVLALILPNTVCDLTCEKTVADIVFVLDDSGSVASQNFQKVKKFTADIIRSLRIGKDQVRVAAISFSTRAVINFQLNKYYDQNSLIRAIMNIRYRRGGTNTHLALRLLNTVFKKELGDRLDAPNIAIVITDGISNKAVSTIKEAIKLQKDGVLMFSIGIGKRLRQSELIAMASKPTSEHTFTVNNFDALPSIKKKITTKTCEVVSTPINKVNPCNRNPCGNGGSCSSNVNGYNCTCQKGFVGKRCESRVPECECSAASDHHYKTFDGQWIHFMGVCKYTLVTPKKSSRLTNFIVEVKNEHRGNTLVSYTRLVDLKLNGVTIRLLPGFKLSVNGVLMTLPLKNYMGFSAVYSGSWTKVTTNFGVKVQFDGRHRVIVRTPSQYRSQLTGICGDCNGKKDDYKTKAGVDVSKNSNRYSIIGRSYEVIDDSNKPQKDCKVVDFDPICNAKKMEACKLLSNKRGPFGACIQELGISAKHYVKSCEFDACAYEKNPKLHEVVVCKAFENLAMKCEELNILMNWRHTAKCPMKCPKDMVYAYKTSACQPSCSDQKPVCNEGFMEGCVCKSGTILSGDKCVPISSCGCTFNGIYLSVGSTFLLNDCNEKIVCLPGGKIKKNRGCGLNTMCIVQNGQRKCGCKEGFRRIYGICQKCGFCRERPVRCRDASLQRLLSVRRT